MEIEKLFEFENNKKLLEFKFSYENLLIWQFIRYDILMEALSKELGYQKGHATSESTTFFEKLRYVLLTVLNMPFKNKQFDIIIFGHGITNYLMENKKYFNRINDYFAMEYEDKTLFIESSARRIYKRPRGLKNIAYHDIIKIKGVFYSKFIKSNRKDDDEIEKFINFLKSDFPFELDNTFYKEIQIKLQKLSVKLKLFHKNYKKIFRKVKPKIIFLEDGSYGAEAHIIKWAKEEGIKVGEFQHGVACYPAFAYNYGTELMKNEEYRKYIPDYFLTYGEFWNDFTNINNSKIVVGSPHFSEMYKKYANKKESGKIKKILIVSQGTITKLMVDLAKELSEKVQGEDYQIIYKLHPGEVPFRERYDELKKYRNILVVESGNIYDLIFEADFIVASSSATVFETIAFDKKLYIYENKDSLLYVPKKVGIWFKTIEELCDLIKQKNSKIETKIDTDYYWNKDWKEKYRKFIENIMK